MITKRFKEWFVLICFIVGALLLIVSLLIKMGLVMSLIILGTGSSVVSIFFIMGIDWTDGK